MWPGAAGLIHHIQPAGLEQGQQIGQPLELAPSPVDVGQIEAGTFRSPAVEPDTGVLGDERDPLVVASSHPPGRDAGSLGDPAPRLHQGVPVGAAGLQLLRQVRPRDW